MSIRPNMTHCTKYKIHQTNLFKDAAKFDSHCANYRACLSKAVFYQKELRINTKEKFRQTNKQKL